MRFQATVIDPPGGWQYGFPKILTLPDNSSEKEERDWFIRNGYPAAKANDTKYGRAWVIEIYIDIGPFEEFVDSLG